MKLVQHYFVNWGVKLTALVFAEHRGWHGIYHFGGNSCIEHAVGIFDRHLCWTCSACNSSALLEAVGEF